jgi:serine/threonine protein kinase
MVMPTRRVDARDVAAAQSLLPGEPIGDYTVERLIAVGGFGAVYEVRDPAGARAALKLLHPDLITSPDMVRRFLRESRSIERLRHPNVVRFLGAGEWCGRPYLLTELLDGVDLERHIADCGQLSPTEALGIIESLAGALGLAHMLGIVHRDIKASNVFLEKGGRVVLLDFGVAKLLEGSGEEMTSAHQIIGTPACMAPEQLRCGTVDARTDVYLVGALLYHMLTGELPYAVDSITTMQHMHLHAPRPRPSALAPSLHYLDSVVERAMATDPQARPRTVAELAGLMRDAVSTPATGGAAGRALGVLLAVDNGVRVSEVLEPLRASGFLVAMRLPTSALLVCPVADEAALDAAYAAVARAAMPGVRVATRVGDAVVDGGKVRGGALTRLSEWRTASTSRSAGSP